MNDMTGESLSAFLDGELPHGECALLLKRIQREPHLQAALHRYSAMGECLRGEPARLSATFTARVCQAVAADAAGRPAVTQLLPRDRLRRIARLAGGLALAATVAGVAILTLQREQVPESPQVAENAPGEGTTVVVGNPDEDFSYTVPTPAETSPAMAGGARLTDYVFAHSEYSTLMGRRNVLSAVIAEDPTPVDIKDQGDDAPGEHP